MSSSLQKSNLRLLFYGAPVIAGFIFSLATGGAVNLPFVAILSQIQATLGSDGFKIVKEVFSLLSSGGVNLLTGEGHERIKEFLRGLSEEPLFSDTKIKEAVKDAIIAVLKDEKEQPEYEEQKENIERLIRALDNLFLKSVKLENDDLSQDFLSLLPKLSVYEIDNFAQAAPPLTTGEWKKLLIDAAFQDNAGFYQPGVGLSLTIPTNFNLSLEKLSQSLEKRFPDAFRRLIQRDLNENGELFAKYTLDFLTKLNNSQTEIIRLLKDSAAKIEKIEQNSSLFLQQSQINQAELRVFLDKVSRQIETLAQSLYQQAPTASLGDIQQLNLQIAHGFATHHQALSQISNILIIIDERTARIERELKEAGKTTHEIRQILEAGHREILSGIKQLAESTRNPLTFEQIERLINEKLRLPSTALAKFQPADFPNRNDYFTGRVDVLKNIESQLKTHGKASLHGLHGLGKTSSVVEYAYEHQEEYDFIFFVRSTKDEFPIKMAELAELFNPSLKENPEQEVKAKWFRQFLDNSDEWKKKDQRFLIVFDNVDDISQVRPYLPSNNNGDVLLTSNLRQIRALAPEVAIEKLEPDEARLLLFRRAEEKPDAKFVDIDETIGNILAKIVAELAYLPLLVDVAGAYIVGTETTYPDYLKMLESSPEIVVEHQDILGDYHHKAAYKAIQFSFDAICQSDTDEISENLMAEAVKQILYACSILAPDNIPEKLLRKYVENQEVYNEIAVKDILWTKTREKLIKFDLLIYNKENKAFEMHQFVQYVIWNYFAEKKVSIIENVMGAIDDLFPSSQFGNWDESDLYLPHAVSTLKYAGEFSLSSEKLARNYDKIGRHLRERIQYNQADDYLNMAVAEYRKLFGEENENVATSLNELAILYQLQGRYDEAIANYEKAIEIDKKTISIEHPEHAKHLSNLAVVYQLQGKFDEAIANYEEAIEIDKKTIGIEHPEHAKHLSNIALVYEAQGKYDDAITKLEEAIEIGKKTIGIEHPNYAISLSNLALVYEAQGKYDAALALYKEALHIDEKTLPENHPYTQQDRESVARCEEKRRGK